MTTASDFEAQSQDVCFDWWCPKCAVGETWSYHDLATRGKPVCQDCDVDMIPAWEWLKRK